MMQLASAQGDWDVFHRQYIGMAAAYAVWLSLVPPPQREGERITPLFEAMGTPGMLFTSSQYGKYCATQAGKRTTLLPMPSRCLAPDDQTCRALSCEGNL